MHAATRLMMMKVIATARSCWCDVIGVAIGGSRTFRCRLPDTNWFTENLVSGRRFIKQSINDVIFRTRFINGISRNKTITITNNRFYDDLIK
jgi:hypothetical protein